MSPRNSVRRRLFSRLLRSGFPIGSAVLAVVACSTPPEIALKTPTAPSATAPAISSASAAPDPLGPKPATQTRQAFVPPTPRVLEGPQGSKIWLLEKHELPLVTMSVIIPYGGATDSNDRLGTAYLAADMLDEGAGRRDSLAFSEAMDDLAAHFHSQTIHDMSWVSVDVLSSKLEPVIDLVADVILRPKHQQTDFTRVSALWQDRLKARGDDPQRLASVVSASAFFGDKHPYGRPLDGTLTSAKNVKLAHIKQWHQTHWRPDAATFLFVGDITAEKAQSLLKKAFGSWTKPKTPLPPIIKPGVPELKGAHTVIVDRPKAPQVILSVVRKGVEVSNPNYALLGLLNIALGGSFTSRLNQNLREDHSWTYGARSRFNLQRGTASFVARAAIHTQHISPALGEMLKEIKSLSATGLSAQEVDKVKAQTQSDMVSSYSTVASIATSLTLTAGLNLPANDDVRALQAQMSSTRIQLNQLAKENLELSDFVVVLVGPKAASLQAIQANKLPNPEFRTADGALVP
jgi:zinc protease